MKSKSDSTIDFGVKFAESKLFTKIFKEGMGLVEETATYLDGVGRRESKTLSKTVAMRYATESMRLTTRLMQLASWLLLQRAVKEGEMTASEARKDKYRVNLAENAAPAINEEYNMLPDNLRTLITKSMNLHRRIMKLDKMLHNENTSREYTHKNPVSSQIEMLNAAFNDSKKDNE